MKLYIIYKRKMVTDQDGKLRSFATRRKASDFVRKHKLFGATITPGINTIERVKVTGD